MDAASRPAAVIFADHAPAVQQVGDLAFLSTFFDERSIHPANRLDLHRLAWDENDPVGLNALVLATAENTLVSAGLVDEHAPQPVPGGSALSIANLDQPALTGEYLGRQFTTVFASHGALDAFYDGGEGAPVILELFGTVVHRNTSPAADILVVRTLVGVLKPAPTADVIDQDRRKIGFPGLDIIDEALEGVPPVQAQPTLAFVCIGADNFQTSLLGVFPDSLGLIFSGVPLVLRRHANVLSRPPAQAAARVPARRASRRKCADYEWRWHRLEMPARTEGRIATHR